MRKIYSIFLCLFFTFFLSGSEREDRRAFNNRNEIMRSLLTAYKTACDQARRSGDKCPGYETFRLRFFEEIAAQGAAQY